MRTDFLNQRRRVVSTVDLDKVVSHLFSLHDPGVPRDGWSPEQYRQSIVANASWCCADSYTSKWNYAEVRPIPDIPYRTNGDYYTDCSGFSTLMCKWSRINDPNTGNPWPNGFTGYGYTGTQLATLNAVSEDSAQAGDLIIYGPGTGYHVVIMLQDWNGNPLVASMGQQGDPNYYYNCDEIEYFGTGIELTFLDVLSTMGG